MDINSNCVCVNCFASSSPLTAAPSSLLGHAADEMCVKREESEKDSIWDGAMSVGEV